jgi:lysophospholipase L1-like esterase
VALRRTVQLLTAAGVEVRLLEMPMASVAAAWDRHDGNEAYREWIRTATAGLGVSTVRTPNGLVVDADFFDPVHLNADGALKFSRWLARDVATALEELEADPSPVQLAQTNLSK